ncbi:MAG: tyrosine--tRNA ligase [Holosporales bacterium]|jgi:tyrosyl-tRNA synthetase|nr:tyrosine--tRNA ligase [Holosporales bacterium]
MFKFKSEIMQTLQERGFIYQGTNIEHLDALFCEKNVIGYIGFDATAPSLQVGNLSAIMLLRWLQKFGHTPMVLVGGGTSRVGDPSFRQTARPIMSLEKIQSNIDGISRAFSHFLHFRPADKAAAATTPSNVASTTSAASTTSNAAIFVNNADWLTELRYVDFLRDYGSFFTVNRMLSFESIKLRLAKEEPLSFLEFNYMIMQAYDFYYLHEHFGCVLQMGGSDQWGNIVNGVELTRRLTGKEVFGLTAPLVTNATGEKMGKTASGAVWLNPDMCSPFDYWQFWRNTDDRDVGRYLRRFTDLPLSEIEKLEELGGEEINEAKKVLADSTTALLHGEEVLNEIHKASSALFGHAAGGVALGGAMPSCSVERGKVPISLAELFVLVGLCESRGDFKRMVLNRGVSLQGQVITDYGSVVTEEDFVKDGYVLLSAGKKRHIKVSVV